MARVRIERGGKMLIALVILSALLFLFFKVKATISPKTPPAVKPPAAVTSSEQIKTQPGKSESMPPGVSEETQKPEGPESASGSNQRILGTKIFFAFNRAGINKNVYCIFDRIEKAVRQSASSEGSAGQGLTIVVEGNADSIGPKWYNIRLSRMRAARVADSLSKRLSIPVRDIKLVANGSSKPIATNSTRDGRADNRRTEVYIYR